ncbi:hypothetical protein Ait01nite_068290 [Actinoplanes italicus]|uniref:Uncharacterized protein n=1 Tax=Actinoplanes italicus TaxID=113567 RepID=A0A2T0K1B0_9ACTN|nr:hypothetical protein [Actinoplanes italicus]PRX16577.1 hypothetical protein CLV67_119158 [Actinoplanes italicus]GIE33784.1 hypothetical protein Ait01nite_068290 [Actinoplanes italicus]
MEPARPLREVFAELAGTGSTGDPGGLLRDLPDELVAEAVVSYAETAPVEIAEHLASFVSAHSAVGSEAPALAGWLDLLATAPVEVTEEPELEFGAGAASDTTTDIDDVEVTGIDEIADLDEAGDLENWDEPVIEGLDADEDWPEIDDDLLE